MIYEVGPAWTASGFAKLSIPFSVAVSGNVLYGLGAGNYETVDQVGLLSRVSARKNRHNCILNAGAVCITLLTASMNGRYSCLRKCWQPLIRQCLRNE